MNNKSAIIIGASGGIGSEIALLLSKNHINITLVGRNNNKLHTLAQKCDSNSRHLIINADITSQEEIHKIFETSHNHWGRTDILINSAGYVSKTNFHTGDPNEWEKMWKTNVFATCVSIQMALKYFNADIGGQIINISSLSGHRVANAGSFYSATKFAITAITESVRQELVQNNSKTRVTSISPGMVNTNFGNNQIMLNQEHQILEPKDIAEIVLFVLNTPNHVQINDILIRSFKQLV